jgi:superfamily I DNA/RNA helicase
MDGDRKPNTGILGRPNKLDESYRLTTKIVNLALDFQKYFFQERYEFDEINIFKQQSVFDMQEKIQYIFLDTNTASLEIYEVIHTQIISSKSHPNDIAVLASTVTFLRGINLFIRTKTHENTQIMFETKEEWDTLHESYSKKNPAQFKVEIDNIRKARKFQFWMNNGTTKFSTIHSFKGLEIQTLILIIENEDNITEELIYAGITRCRNHLIIINIGNQKYHEFFKTISP